MSYQVNFCETKEQLKHLAEVVTGKADGSPTGADIDTSTLAYAGLVRDTLPELLSKLGWYSVGEWPSDPLISNDNEYVLYNGIRYVPLSVPYQVNSTTNPDPETLVGTELKVITDVTNADLTESQEELLPVGSRVYPKDGALQNGQSVPSGATHLRVSSGDEPKIFSMSPATSGVVTGINFDAYGFPVSVSFGASTSNLKLEVNFDLFTHVSQFGIKPENSAFWNTQAWERAKSVTKHLIFDASDYNFSRFEVDDNISIYMKKGGRILVSGGAAPQVNIGSNVETWNTWFESLDADLQWNRVALDDSTDVTMNFPVFKGFKHNNPLPDAWGCLIQRCKRITMNCPKFDDNSQADIAFTDFNEDIEIKCINSIDEAQGARVNFEPNGDTPNKRIRFVGGIVNNISLLTNTRRYDVNNFMKFTEVWIKRLVWDGADVIFENCQVDEYDNFRDTEVYAGTVSSTNSHGMGIGPNLLDDPYVTSLSAGTSTKWVVDFSDLPVDQRYSLNENPRLVDLNPLSQNGTVYIKNTDIIGTQPGEILLFAITGQLISDLQSQIANGITLRYLSSGSLVESVRVRAFLQLQSQNEEFKTNVAFVKTPDSVDSVQVVIANSFDASTAKLRLKSASLHKVEKFSAFDSVLSQIHTNQCELAKVVKPTEIYAYNLPMIDGQDVLIGGFRHTVSDGGFVNPTSGQVVPEISKYSLTVI